ISVKPKKEATEDHEKLLTNILNKTQHLIAYSDGSKMKEAVGCGVWIKPQEGKEVEIRDPLGDQAEVYDAELLGITRAMEGPVPSTPHAIEIENSSFLNNDHFFSIENSSLPSSHPSKPPVLILHLCVCLLLRSALRAPFPAAGKGNTRLHPTRQ